MDLYKILGVSEDCCAVTVRKRFHKLSLRFHPDRTKAHTEEYKNIVLAYSILSDPTLRHEYDQLRMNDHKVAKTFHELKKDREEVEDLQNLRAKHQVEIEERHRHLLSAYRPRTLNDFEKPLPPPFADGKKVDLKNPVKKGSRRTSDLIPVQTEPKPYNDSRQLVEYQTPNDRLGEMYYSGKADVTPYLLDVSREDVRHIASLISKQAARLEDRARQLEQARAPIRI